MSNDQDSHYPDLPPNGLGDLQKIERLPMMLKTAPKIRWGDEYALWPIEKRLSYAERLASSMNHAADILQKERNKLLEVALQQEAQLKLATLKYIEQGELIHKELARADQEKQELYKAIGALQEKLRTSRVGARPIVLSHSPVREK